MFGLENKKKKNSDESIFDLEVDLKRPEKQKEIKEKIENRLQNIKAILRAGEQKEEFDQFAHLIYGYTSMLKVISKFGGKSN